MTKSPGHGFSFPLVIFCLVLIFNQGCTRNVLQTYPAGRQESAAAVEAFARFREANRELCPCCLDAEADTALAVSGWFKDHTLKFSGYLQAMKPGYVKFVALNPLGQPLYIFVTDGKIFTGVDVYAEKAYSGSTRSQTFRKFTPRGFTPELFYYWLTGRLKPGDLRLQAIMRSREEGKFWLQINHPDTATDSMVLFDPGELVILRHVIRDGSGAHLIDISYGDYQQLPGAAAPFGENGPVISAGTDEKFCLVPASISFFSKADDVRFEIKLSAFLEHVSLSPVDFQLDVPGNFKQLLVE